ncbi:aldehyde dehydrogenase (NAD+) [Paenibacillus cellulosilyticus]|uniref:Aldehyde dehydrogenase n=1 Tax=Paenibacillus cellulosilyticus TaxID=375489 RepID=A0A2V2Z0C7_9BACL|nr:aldehyde dehydrogenase [Paenibacillus cellulosilyticus]PWW08595.1 aldehyde dehydrogenase (NAD+) [Paenibacillus cellulosilyticus]QKS48164.1 aldehyde dehydrogenase [Paenibacillus cellulosilyticus]
MDIPALIGRQRVFFKEERTRPLGERLKRLQALREAVKRHEPALLAAVQKDLHKSEFEAFTTEIGLVYKEIGHALKHLRKWAKPKRVRTPLTHWGSKSYIVPEPYGVALIIAPWNYPLQLALVPLVGAVAAGNTVVLKPSELAPHVSRAICAVIADAFEPEWVSVVEGGVEASTALLEEKTDYILFTGSTHVGRIVMTAAAKHLTPVTLELGGKSPCIVSGDADLKLAAKRIAFGKFTNAGQTCVAPDYVYVQREVKDAFLEHLTAAVKELYGADPLRNPGYTHLISDRHYKRLAAFLNDGQVVIGGQTDSDQLAIAPTVLDHVDWSAPVMQDEIFGPVLPVLTYDRIEEVYEAVLARPKPLALYLFSSSRELQQRVVERLSFGGGCINDTLMHFASSYLPVGGVGESGLGSYHGENTFFTFSHQKSVLRQATWFDIPLRYPTSKAGLKIIRRLMK